MNSNAASSSMNESEKNRTLDCSYREIWKLLEEEVLHKCLNKSSSKMLIQVHSRLL